MLNVNRVLEYIKAELGHPILNIELSDDDIVHHITTFSIREFSRYVPDNKKVMYLNLLLEANQVPGIQNKFYLTEPDGLEILNVSDVYYSSANLVFHGHPPIGPLSLGELKNFILDVETAMMVKLYSSWDYTHEFIHPNILRISPVPSGMDYVLVEYERMQPADFSGIPNDLQHPFTEFCLADIMIRIGRIRKKFGGQMRTQFGEIPLNDDIFEEGKEKKRELLDKLEAMSVPNVRIDIG